jgi:UDP-N-acetylmuramoyl-tripeptide--D-alanyl-D-alanine ligase
MANQSTPPPNHARFTLQEILDATGGEIVQLPDGVTLDEQVTSVSTDTRQIAEGALFIALHGARFDGHEYVSVAAARGARAALIETSSLGKAETPPADLILIRVKSTLRALGALAKAHRARFAIPIVGITGSYGKTTTRAMIAATLSAKYKVLCSEGNFNNEVGVPQTLLQLDSTHEAAVVEMAMRGVGQIEYLADIVQPTVGVITNVGPQHIELLGSLENIAATKSEILRFLREDDCAVLPADDEFIDFFTDQVNSRVVRFGRDPSAEYCVSAIRADERGNTAFALHDPNSAIVNLQLPLPGEHNAINAAAAIAVAGVLDVPLDAAARALEKVEVPGARMRVVKNETLGITVIDDCYNAGPTSMRAALETLRNFPDAARRVAILGSMKELGAQSTTEHRNVGALAAHIAEVLLGVGDETKVLLDAARQVGTIPFHEEWFADAQAAAAKVLSLVRAGDVVLVKGSRSVGLEAVVNALADRE